MIILICGKVCSGKTTYAKQLMQTLPAVRLNPDEIMKSLFGEHLSERHEEVFLKTLHICFRKAAEIHECGMHAIIDAGFWQRHLRREANLFFESRGIKPEWHYVYVSDTNHKRNIARRNEAALLPGSVDYYIDENILAKFSDPDDEPSADEMDVLYETL